MLASQPQHLQRRVRLSRKKKAPHAGDSNLSYPSRREFLRNSCLGAAATALPAGLGTLAFPYASPQPAELHFHPHYRAQLPLEPVLLNTKAGLDQFVTEKYHDQIASILTPWAAAILRSPQETEAMERSLSSDFSGSLLTSFDSRILRPGSIVQVRGYKPSQTWLGREAFLQSWRSGLSTFARILTAELQITRMDVPPSPPGRFPSGVKTRVRYELVGTGPGFYREQRVGEWDLEWQGSAGQFLLGRWQALEETRSRSVNPVYADITAAAFGSNPSYSAQLKPGVDHWRTVLDVACGIDIYGHNGVSAGDINGNGLDDLYVCQPAGLPNRLFRNRGDGTFEDITEGSGLGLMEDTACALFADINNDGHQDLIVVRTDGPQMFMNDGRGKFRPKLDAFRFATPPQGTFTGAAIADYDRDGYLDIYFCLYLYYQGSDQYKYPSPYFDAENGPPNFLMKNNRDGTFRDGTAEAGLNQNNTRYSFCCAWSDFNNDGWPDLYVVNDFGRKNLYRNNGDGTFTDIASPSGVEDIGAGMSVCCFDYDNDGNQDLYVANMWTAAGQRISAQDDFQKGAPPATRALYQKHAMGNSLFRNRSDGKFHSRAGVEMGRWAWSSDAWDFDHDGFPDLYVTNGMVSGPNHEDLNSFFWRQVVANSPAEAKPSGEYEQGWNAVNELLRSDGTWSGYERNVFYANNHDGSFSDVSGALGLDFLEDGRSFALADFNRDGRLEILLKNRNAPQLRLLKNIAPDLPSSIAFRLQGTKSNRDAIGAKITLESELENQLGSQTRTLQAGSGFLSQHSKELFFGLGEANSPVKASIQWPSGLLQNLSNLPPNHRIWVTEGAEPNRIEPFSSAGAEPPKAFPDPPLESVPATIETWLLAPIAAPDVPLPVSSGEVRTAHSLPGQPVLLTFDAPNAGRASKPQALLPRDLAVIVVTVEPEAEYSESASEAKQTSAQDAAAIYNLLFRYLFDRHRDFTLPTSFLLDREGFIVKTYQGPIDPVRVADDLRNIPTTTAQRLEKGLPFSVVTDATEFRRNYLSLGSIFFQRGYYEQSDGFFRAALKDDPNSAEAHYGLGSACLKLQNNSEALKSFQRATQLHSAYPDTLSNAWNNLGLLATEEGRTAEAIASFQRALRENPNHFIAMVNLGNAYRQQRQWREARETLTQALTVKPEDPEGNYALGMVFAETDDTARAFDYLQRALKARPAYPEALNNLGVLYLRTRRRDQAVTNFEECIRIAPKFDQSYLNLARVYALEGEPLKARLVLLDLLKQRPHDAQAQSALGQLPNP